VRIGADAAERACDRGARPRLAIGKLPDQKAENPKFWASTPGSSDPLAEKATIKDKPRSPLFVLSVQ